MSGGRLPAVGGRDVLRALLRAGFVVDRIVGSHHVLVYPSDAHDLKRGTLRSIIRQAGFTVDEFTDSL
jgi:predicted RNA binding protein YcfA (HicA-like mRNA interferase family)